MKIFCRVCNLGNSNYKHFDSQVYRVRIHVLGTKILEATDYADALIEAIAFEKELNATEFTTIGNEIIENVLDEDIRNDYSLADAVIRYSQYLNGESNYALLKKDISVGHRKELLRYCKFYSQNVHKKKNITKLRVKDIARDEVSDFFKWADNKYKEKTLKKFMGTLKGFFEFLIDIEEIDMRNPFRTYIVKDTGSSVIKTIIKEEFQTVLEAVDTADPIFKLGGKGEKKNLYRSYLKQAYKLFLLTGCRREELVVMKWNDFHNFNKSVKFMYIDNIKVQRIKNRSNILSLLQ
ncbi:site-specific integrase [Flavobacterium frigoris]|uniref:Core-binding (CB) domain-containing protein n=1 Tax=Flavobacterium frigoris (strain PS1) TaxID=1086011 RepID=H7FLV3_FLAFP|nr:site-specific integrase [Flavobacterium frigoris]EIA10645.1 hypothetical protein HJ01_00151 [Flavobacterium frigoris PS1]